MSIAGFLGMIIGGGMLLAGVLGWIFHRKEKRSPECIGLEELFRELRQ